MASSSTDIMTKRVLAIDDDETILGVIANVLKLHDYESATATQWVEALDALNERPPDLLLLDLQMPHVDGFFLLEWLREQEIEVPVIVVSAYLDDVSLVRLKSLGVDAFVWKPFNVAELAGKVTDIIGPSLPSVPAEPEEDIDPVSGPPPVEGESDAPEVESLALDESPETDTVRERPKRRRLRRRRRRGTKKRERRRNAMYLAVIAIISIGVSSLSIYLRNIATDVEKAVEQEMAGKGDESELLKELLRAQIESQMKQDRRSQAPPPKKLDLKLPRK